MRRPVVDWMVKSDDAILEFLADVDIALPPRAIAFNLAVVSEPTVNRRLPGLEQAGLVNRYDKPKGYTEITDKGRAYLAGELDASELED